MTIIEVNAGNRISITATETPSQILKKITTAQKQKEKYIQITDPKHGQIIIKIDSIVIIFTEKQDY